MVRRITFSAALAALIVVCRIGPGLAADAPSDLSVPTALQGAWYVGESCSDVTSYFFRGDGWSVGIEEQADSETIEADSSLFSVLQLEPDGSMVVSSYWEDPVKRAFVPAKFKLTRSGSRIVGAFVSPSGAVKVPKISEIRCDNPEIAGKPWPLVADYLSDLTGLLDSISTVQHACNTDPHACADAVVSVLDLNHDGKVSAAELVSFFRRVSKLGILFGKTVPGTSMSHAEFTLEQVMGAELGAAVVGPIFAQIVMSNIDDDGDGFIEPNELETFLRQVGMPSGHGYLGRLIESAKDSAEQAAHSLNTWEQLLGAFGGH